MGRKTNLITTILLGLTFAVTHPALADAPEGEVPEDEVPEDEVPEDEVPWTERHAFERDFALGLYATGWAGHYEAVGAGARARWEPMDHLGVEVYTEHAKVRAEGGRQHDHPIGFNLYVPVHLTEWLRFRPLFGFCAVFSFFHPEQEGVDTIHDIHFGVHGGAGLELALGRFASLFLDLQAVMYFGHDRYTGGWMTHVGDELTTWGVAQGTAGLQIHL